MTLISFCLSPLESAGVTVIFVPILSLSPSGLLTSTLSTLTGKDEEPGYHLQHNLKRKTAASV